MMLRGSFLLLFGFILPWEVRSLVDDGKVKIWSMQPRCVGDEATCGWAAGNSLTVAEELIVERINLAGILAPYTMVVTESKDDHCSGGKGLIIATNLLLLTPPAYPFALMGSGCSGATASAAQLVNIARLPHVSHCAASASLSDRVKFPSFYRMSPPDNAIMPAWFKISFSLGITSFIAPYDLEYGNGMLVALNLLTEGYKGKMTNLLPTSAPLAVMTEASVQVASILVSKMIQLRVRMAFLLLYPLYVRQFMCAQHSQGMRGTLSFTLGWMAPGFMRAEDAIVPCTPAQLDSMFNYHFTASYPGWGPRSDPLACDSSYTTGEFRDEYERRRKALNLEYRVEAAATGDAFCMIALLWIQMRADGYTFEQMHRMSYDDFEVVKAKQTAMTFQGISGGISFPSDRTAYGAGDRQGPITMLQYIDGSFVLKGNVLPTGVADVEGAGWKIEFLPDMEWVFDEGYTMASPPSNLYPKCPAGSGQVYHHVSGKCVGCVVGKEVFVESSNGCSCAPGFAGVGGACEACAAGKFSKTTGSLSCDNCTIGTYSVAGKNACNFCPKGRYASEEGMGLCTQCSTDGQLTTINIAQTALSACVCVEGTYRPADSIKCLPCPEGMACSVGSDVANYDVMNSANKTEEQAYPILKPQFWSSVSMPLSVYACANSERCRGGEPGVCADGLAHMTGIACGVCEEKYFPNSESCQKCNGIEESGILYPTMPIILGPVIIALMHWRMRDPVDRWGSWRNVLGSLGFLTLNHYQVVGLITRTNVPYPDTITVNMEFWGNLVDMASVLRPACSGYTSFAASFIISSTAPLLIFAMFLVTGLFSVIAAMIAEKVGKADLNLKCDHNVLFNIYMSLLVAFFVSVASLSLQLFVFYPHPNGKSSLLSAPDVIVGESEWSSLVVVAVFAIIIYCICLLALCTYIIYIAPQKFHDEKFRIRWKFLFLKFRPDVWWWTLPVMIKGLCMNLSLVFFQDGILQLYWILLTLLAYTGGLVFTFPWRHSFANSFDIYTCTALIAVTALGSWFSTATDDLQNTVGVMVTTVSFTPLGMVIFLAAVLIRKSAFTGSDAAIDQLADRITKTYSELIKSKDTTKLCVEGLNPHDRKALDGAAAVINAELFAEQPSTRWISQRLIPHAGKPKLGVELVIGPGDAVNKGEDSKEPVKAAPPVSAVDVTLVEGAQRELAVNESARADEAEARVAELRSTLQQVTVQQEQQAAFIKSIRGLTTSANAKLDNLKDCLES